MTMTSGTKKTPKRHVLEGSDFGSIGEIASQANALLFGDGGSGKTTFALNAPSPIAFINFDNRAKHAVKKAEERGQTVHYMHVDFPANFTQLSDEEVRKIGQASVKKVIKNFEIAIKESLKGNVRTICLDTATEYAEIVKLAVTGRIDRVKGDYGRSKDLINREFWRLCNMAREGGAHFLMLSRARAIWENNEPTGKFQFRGPEVMNDAVDWAAHIRLHKPKSLKKTPTVKKFEIEVTKAGINIDELGAVYTSDDWDAVEVSPFVYACTMQYPGTDFDEWQ